MLSVGGNSSEINKLHRKTKQKTLAEEYNQTMELRVTKALKEEDAQWHGGGLRE
jgi:hypothetical protein